MYSQEDDRKLFNELLECLKISYENPHFYLLFRRIIEIYARQGRYYYNFGYVRQRLSILKRLKLEIDNLPAMTLAIWFLGIEQGFEHRQRSADTMKILLKPYRSFLNEEIIDTSYEFILNTIHPSFLITNDSQVIHDLDLYFLGGRYEQCLSIIEKIRKEYPNLSKKRFSRQI